MSGNRNRHKSKTPLDLDVIQNLDDFEYNFCSYVDAAIPNKFRDTYIKQILDALSDAMKNGLLGFSHDTKIFPREKLDRISNSLGDLYFVQTRLNRLNDMQQISDKTKAVFDMKLNDILDGFSRFSNSLRNIISIAGQVPSGTPSGEAGELEGCLTGHQ